MYTYIYIYIRVCQWLFWIIWNNVIELSGAKWSYKQQQPCMTPFCTATILLGIQLSAPPQEHWKLRESMVETYGGSGFLWRTVHKCILNFMLFLLMARTPGRLWPFILLQVCITIRQQVVGLWKSLNLLLKLIPAVLKTRQIWHPSGTGRWKCNFRAILHCQIPVASGM